MNIELKEKLEKFYDEQVWPHITLGEFIEDCAKKYGDKIALVDGDVELSYQELNRKACHYANGLLKAGFKKGDRIVLQLPNCHEFVIILFAMFKIGVIPVLSLPAHRKNEIKGILEKSGAIAYIAKDKYLGFSHVDMIREVREELNIDFEVYILGDNQGYKNFYNLDDKDYLSQQIEINYKEIGLLLLSGGTTGIPKLIPRRHCDYIYVAKESGIKSEFNLNTKFLAILPMAHNFTLCCPGVLGTLAYGGTVFISNTASPDEFVPIIENNKINTIQIVPSLIEVFLEYVGLLESDVSSLELMIVGAAKLEPKQAMMLENTLNVRIQQSFGLAEGLICMTDVNDSENIRYNFQGKPISKYDEILVVDSNNQSTKPGEVGQLLTRGPYTIYGYYNYNEDETVVNEDNYFITGDKIVLSKDGNINIIGRLKDTIIKNGENIEPREIEKTVIKMGGISKASIVGIKNKNGEEIICLYMLSDEAMPIDHIRKYLIKEGLASYKLPDVVECVEEFPLTAVGKIDKNRLKEMYKELHYDTNKK